MFVLPKCLFSGKYQLQIIDRKHLHYLFQFVSPFFCGNYAVHLQQPFRNNCTKTKNANYGRENEAKSSKGQLFIDMQIDCLIDCLEQLQNDF